ncbi:MAG: GNVR domain-containing protein, partial [Terriglobia bacterium]
DLYIGMLKSRTVADNLIQRFDLNKLYEQKFQSDTRKMLERLTQINAGKDGIITIEVDDKDPKRAAALANAYVDELYKLTQTLAVTEASQRRLFFERQFAQTRENLARAEMAARQALEKGGLANVDAQSRGILETTAKLRAQISAKEIELSAMRTFATGRNPDLVRGQEELVAMKGELAKIEGATGITGNARGSAAALGLDNVRLLREVKYNEALYELLAKQYELARIDEANDAAIIQVLDKALEPEKKSKPKRALIVILTALVAGFFAIIWAFIREAGERARQNPQQAERLETLRRYVRGK